MPELHVKPGSVFVLALIFLFFVVLMSTAVFSQISHFVSFGADQTLREQAVNVAEAGVEYALWKINNGIDPQTGVIPFGNAGEFQITIEPALGSPPWSSGNRKIKSIGFVPNFLNRKIKATAQVEIAQEIAQGTTFPYAEQAGTGGISSAFFGGTTTVTGKVFSNAAISGPSSAFLVINGEAWATSSITRVSGTGLRHPNYDPPETLPTFVPSYWEGLALAGAAPNPIASCCSSSQSLGPKTINGDLTIGSLGNNTITITGPVHVKGALNMSGGILKPSDSLGSQGTVILVDGCISITRGPSFPLSIQTNSQNGYLLIVTKKSVPWNSPSCGNGGNPGIMIGSFYPSVINAIFYALNGQIHLDPNLATGVQITGALVAPTILHGSSTTGSVTYNNDVSSLNYPTSSEAGAWQIVRGTYKFK